MKLKAKLAKPVRRWAIITARGIIYPNFTYATAKLATRAALVTDRIGRVEIREIRK